RSGARPSARQRRGRGAADRWCRHGRGARHRARDHGRGARRARGLFRRGGARDGHRFLPAGTVTLRVGLIGTGFARRVQVPALRLELVLRPYVRGDGRPQAFDAPWSWWYDAARGGGILGAVGSHLIDLCRFWTGSEVVEVSGRVATFVPERYDEQRVRHAVTADEYASFVMRLASGAVATITLTTVAAYGPGHFAQITGRDGTLLLTGETTLEVGHLGGPLEDTSVPDDLWEQTAPNNMWARSFVRLMRDVVAVLDGRPAAGEPATFYDGLAVQRVMDAVRDGRCARL